MTRDESVWINAYFGAASRDETPAPVRNVARMLYVPISREAEVTRRCASILSDVELRRADRLRVAGERYGFVQRRAFRRFCGALAVHSRRPLSRIVFGQTRNGRPYLLDRPDCWFSFSSCRFGFVGAWSWMHGIGVDAEDRTRLVEAPELARRFFSAPEARAVAAPGCPAGLRTFFRLWCLKEAALKSIGEGLPYGLDAFAFETDPIPRVLRAPSEHGGPRRFEAHVIEGADRCTSLVIRRPTIADGAARGGLAGSG